jgi:hypothetical protein
MPLLLIRAALMRALLLPAVCSAAVLPPVITTQPASQTVASGQPVTFQAVVTSSTTPYYQWRKSGTNIAGATNSSYVIASAQSSSQASYSVVVTNLGGSATSTNATLTVVLANSAPVLNPARSPALSAVNEDAGAPSGPVGTLVSSLIDFASPTGQVDNVTDSDAGALLGIAVTAADSANGTWYYSTNNGAAWNALGAVSGTYARLLAADANSRLCFLPNTNWSGTLANAITFRAWDRTSGVNGGTGTARASGDLLDSFAVRSYSNNDGSEAWNGDWVDIDATVLGGSINIASDGTLTLKANNATDWIYRAADLAGVSNATVSFDYNSDLNSASGGLIYFQVSSNGGSSYATLATFSSTTRYGTGTFSADITAYASSNTRIRFLIAGDSSPTRHMEVDNLRIAFTSSSIGGATAFSSATDGASLTINPVNDAPTAISQGGITPEDTAKAVTLAGSDVENSPLTFSIVSNPAHGTLSGAAPNLTYTPAANFFGTDSFNFTANDGSLTSAVATVTITVTAVNDAPAANAQSVSAPADTARAITLTGTDVENSPLNFSIVSNPGNGVLSGLNPSTGAVTYTPNANFSGADSFTFRVNDGTTNSATATVSLTVTPVAPTIVTQPQGQTLTAGQNATFTVAATGTAPFGYQWCRNGTPLADATSSTLTLSQVQSANAGNYSVIVSNAAGSVSSAMAALLVTNPPPMLAQDNPASLTPQGFSFGISVPVGATVIVEASSNCRDWAPIATNIAASGTIVFTDSEAANFLSRMYRARLP